MTVRPGDALLYAVSASRDVNWESFKRLVDAVCVPDGQFATEMRFVRTEAVDVGSELGHWEVIRTDTATRIVIAPPVLARLPWPGRPRAVLCGSRSPDTISEIRQACDAIGGLSIAPTDQAHHPFAPKRVEVCGDTEEQLSALASELSLRFDSTPAAWSMACTAGSVGGYLESLSWETNEELNWDSREFDIDALAFRSSAGGTNRHQFRLVAYSHQSGWTWRDWLWNGGRVAETDRSWGRYCLLAITGRSVLRYDHRSGVATVPRQVPLPRLHARALALSSGKAPGLEPGIGIGLRAYRSVSHPIFDVVASKMHQHLPPLQFNEKRASA